MHSGIRDAELRAKRPGADVPLTITAAIAALVRAMLDAGKDVQADIDEWDLCAISFTSGTTGVPKGTMHFHRDVIAMCDAFPRSCLKPSSDDVFCGTPPIAFTFGLGGLLCFPMRFGASVALDVVLHQDGVDGGVDLAAEGLHGEPDPQNRQHGDHDQRELARGMTAWVHGEAAIAPIEAAAIPLPRDETTPPVMKMYFVLIAPLPPHRQEAASGCRARCRTRPRPARSRGRA